MQLNIISDIAGQFSAFEALLHKMPDAFILSVGDLIHKGPQSMAVLNWFRHKSANREALALMGNHEKLAIDAVESCLKGNPHAKKVAQWLDKGGGDALKSIDPAFSWPEASPKTSSSWARALVDACQRFEDQGYLSYLKSLPLAFKTESQDLLVSHAPLKHPRNLIEVDHWHSEGSYLYILTSVVSPKKLDQMVNNRCPPRPFPPYFFVFGHNSRWGCKTFFDRNAQAFAMCIDTSRQKQLTGLNFPNGKLFHMGF
jgi:hypothetical protein